MSPKKTVLKVTPNAPGASLQKVKQKNDYLRECINSIVKKEVLHLNFKKIFSILVNDLHINLKNVSPRLKFVLSECLCYYMKSWPGWQKYDVVCINERAKMDYYEKFKEYLIWKMNYIIENEQEFYPEMVNRKHGAMVSQEIQTEPINKKNKPQAPYSLVISGQPNVLNNIVFIETDNNIVIKQHAEKPWKPLNVAEFLNYSFVFVSIKLPEVELSRSNLHEFQRHISESGDIVSCPEVDFITYIRKQDTSKPKVYSMDFIHAYFKQFIETIRKVPGVNAIKRTELEEIFRQFVLDIQESNVFNCTNSSGATVKTMATNTSVCFNIGGKTYIRNKKMVVNNDNGKETNAINYCEVLIPRMAYTLNKFSAREDATTEEDTSFRSLNEINIQINKNSPELFRFIEAVNSCVTYQCLLCPKVYSGDRAYIDILDHYRFLHKGEQSVLCFVCRKQFLISMLAGSRWSHNCVTQTTENKENKETSGVANDVKVSNAEPLPTISKPPVIVPNIPAHVVTATGSNFDFGINQVLTSDNRNIDTKPILPKLSTGVNESLTNTNLNRLSIDNLLGNQDIKVAPPPVVNTSIDFFNGHFGTYDSNSANTPFINTLPVVSTLSTINSAFPTPAVLLAITPGSVASSNTISHSPFANSNASCSLITSAINSSISADIDSDLNIIKTEPENVDSISLNNVVDSESNINLASITSNISGMNSIMSSTTDHVSFANLSISAPSTMDNVIAYPSISTDLLPDVTTLVNSTVPTIVDPNTTSMNTHELLQNEIPIASTSTTSELLNPLMVTLTPVTSEHFP